LPATDEDPDRVAGAKPVRAVSSTAPAASWQGSDGVFPSQSLKCEGSSVNFWEVETIKSAYALNTHKDVEGSIDAAGLAAFLERLNSHKLDMSEWGHHGKKTPEELYFEAVVCRESILTGLKMPGMLKRVTRFVKIRLTAEIRGVSHTLYSRMQFRHDGFVNEERRVPLRKLHWKNSVGGEEELDHDTCIMEDCPYTEDWRHGCQNALEERFKLPPEWQKQHLQEVPHSYSYRVEDNVKSDGYPGLRTLYCIHEVAYEVVDAMHCDVQSLGLPMGIEFVTTDGDFHFTKQEEKLPLGAQMNIWAWLRDAPPAPTAILPSVMNVPSAGPVVNKQTTNKSSGGQVASKSITRSNIVNNKRSIPGDKSEGLGDDGLHLIRRVPLPAHAAQSLGSMQVTMREGDHRPPNAALWAALEGRRTDWARANKIAKRILEPNYSLRDFNEDLIAFPELNLYLLEKIATSGSTASGSGRSLGDEYQRTLGAFFAIYWLMRLPLDGKDGFSFGVDDNWTPLRPCDLNSDDERLKPLDKREAFLRDGKWDYFGKLLAEAGLFRRSGWSGTKVNEKRLVSLLALTAFHDIMKISLFLPTVQPEHSPYHGYNTGDIIADHDKALSYVMDHYPEMLPSFRELDDVERQAVQFTQCNLCFNHGWFVQAEAPPGATFTKFREVIAHDAKSRVGKSGVAFYFVHWLTDLAGAEPTPLGGCEKFVIKFPLAVLNSFLRSFEFVETVAVSSETQTMESYLKVRWDEHLPSPGPSPEGESAVARMRLLCMAQANATKILEAFESIDKSYQEILSREMARTGCKEQTYSAGISPAEVQTLPAGPAFLIYYGPALLQSLGSDDPVRRLSLLGEVYRCAREVWPLEPTKADLNVIVRVDVIKALTTEAILQASDAGSAWVLVKQNDSEGVIEKHPQEKADAMVAGGEEVRILNLARLKERWF
jgi:hypothetical protein